MAVGPDVKLMNPFYCSFLCGPATVCAIVLDCLKRTVFVSKKNMKRDYFLETQYQHRYSYMYEYSHI
jgi:hypothetical protein